MPRQSHKAGATRCQQPHHTLTAWVFQRVVGVGLVGDTHIPGCTQTYMHTNIYIRTHIHTYSAHMHTHTHVHICTDTCTHTHTHRGRASWTRVQAPLQLPPTPHPPTSSRATAPSRHFPEESLPACPSLRAGHFRLSAAHAGGWGSCGPAQRQRHVRALPAPTGTQQPLGQDVGKAEAGRRSSPPSATPSQGRRFGLPCSAVG